TERNLLMLRSRFTGGLALLVAGLLALGTSALSGQEKKAPDKHAQHFEQCAKACADCMRECESCAHHCADLIAGGQKEHMRTLGTCSDCAEFCAAAGRIVSHHGPMSGTICEACAKACDICGSACDRFPNDEHMKKCAQECHACARACREMLKHI